MCENTLSAASPRPGETTPRDHRACLRLSSPIYPRSNIEKRVGKYVSCYDRTNFLTVPAPLPAKLEQLPGTSRPRVPIDASSSSPITIWRTTVWRTDRRRRYHEGKFLPITITSMCKSGQVDDDFTHQGRGKETSFCLNTIYVGLCWGIGSGGRNGVIFNFSWSFFFFFIIFHHLKQNFKIIIEIFSV